MAEDQTQLNEIKIGVDPKSSLIYQYYSTVLPAEDFEHFLEGYLRELPAVFRIQKQARSLAYEEGISALLEQLFSHEPLCRLSHPQFAYEMDFSRRALRSSQELNEAHKTIVALNESSFITREELVSMYPPLFLAAQPGEKILDMCAAPGQKTQEILEAVGPTGLIVANDSSLSRAHTLMHNLIDEPTTELVITNLDATKLPDFPVIFDRVLADVPCSGDGTLRKAPDVWRHWKPSAAFYLHTIEIGCLVRGLMLLKVGGRIVYSTCSMNFIENEAVVGWVLNEFKGSVKVTESGIEGIESKSGFRQWPSLDEMPETARFAYSAEISDQLQLTHRFYPWITNSGGFYVAVLEKTAELDRDHPYVLNMRESIQKYVQEAYKAPFRGDQSKTMPMHPFSKFEREEVANEIKREFGFSHIFAPGDTDDRLNNLLVRLPEDGSEPSRMYLVNKHVSSIFNVERSNDIFRIVELGCGAFNKESGSDRSFIYRIESNVNFLLKNTRRVVDLTYASFMQILEIGLGEFENDTPESVKLDELEQADIAQDLRSEKIVGQVLLRITDGPFATFLSEFCISAWLGANSIGIHMKKKARFALRCLLKQEMIDQLIISGQTKRKQAHRERRAARIKGEKTGNGKNDNM